MRALLATLLLAGAPTADKAPEGTFVSVKDAIPSVIVETRYRTSHNFIGEPIDGYRDDVCLVTTQTAKALAEVQRRVRKQGYTLKFYDCYRPQRAVDQFVAWAKRLQDTRTKAEFYPRVAKTRLFKDGYIAAKSGHSRGSTVDLTLVRRTAGKQERYRRANQRDCALPAGVRFRDNSIDMGTGYDCLDPLSHPFNGRIGGKQRKNRLTLRHAMVDAGFNPLPTEWWHFTLADEPFPERYFDFPVARASVR